MRVVRTLRRSRFAKGGAGTSPLVGQHALVEVQRGVRALRRAGSWVTIRTVLPRSLDELLEQSQDLVGALAVEVAGGLVAQQERGVGHDGARDRHALLLAARELARLVLARGRRGPRRRARSPRGACARPATSGVSSSGSSTLRNAVSTGIRLYIWKTKPTWRARQAVSFARHSRRDLVARPRVMLPALGTSRPPSRFSSVVLPEPLGPMKATKSPLSTSG